MARRDSPLAAAFELQPRTIFALDLTRRGPGAPPGVRFAEGSLVVGEHQGKPAIVSTSPGLLVVPLAAPLPEIFTIEMTVVHRATAQVGASTVRVYGGRARVPGTGPTAAFEYGTLFWSVAGGGARAEGNFNPGPERDDCIGAEVPVRLQVSGDRIRAWAGDRQLAEVSGARFRRDAGLVIELEGRSGEGNQVYLTGLRVAGPAQETQAPARVPTELAARTITVQKIVASGPFPRISVPRIEARGAIPVVHVPKIIARGVKAP